jgi:hypothetical protein
VAYIIAYLHLYSLFSCEMRCLVLIFEPDNPKDLRNITPHRPMWTGRLMAISTYKKRIYIRFPPSFDRLSIAYLATLLLGYFPTGLLQTLTSLPLLRRSLAHLEGARSCCQRRRHTQLDESIILTIPRRHEQRAGSSGSSG